MPSPSKKSYGPEVQARVRYLLQVLLEGVAEERELRRGLDLKWIWSEDDKTLTVETTLRSLVLLAHPDLATNTDEFKSAKSKAGESLNDLRDFVEILDDHRIQKRGSDKWHFSLRLWSRDIQRNLAEFDKLWESKRSPTTKAKPAPETPPKSPLKPGAPFPRVRLPENFVERPHALQAVKEKLLVESDQTLVVSAIAGLGGLGKSVLATALVLDPEVQTRFSDGILWVTLGQKPDLQTLLGDWIRELDKSREAFSANTLESASRYLDSLLAERRVLLVVDDVWNADDAEWFRVGGAGCRVLVTTREAQLEGAEYYPLDLMTEEEAIALVQKKLKQKWRSEQEAEVKTFAKVLGYLPLALDLAANQVRDGLSWAELRSEFEAERRSVALGTGRRSRALELLDSSEAWEHLAEEKRRKYSLQACFNLSLKRLSDEQLRQFAWLGVLPEDVSLNKQMAAVLWNVRSPVAQKILALLRNRSFLTDGAATLEDEPTYRVHDLMHDVARSLIEQGILEAKTQTVEDPSQNLMMAHRHFLERYRGCASDHRWDKLPNDRYIHRHLTWHMEQAHWTDEVHALMVISDERGRNAWFEVCDRIGQPAVFVEDVARGWRLAEELYEQEPTRAIVLQCRYAMIQATQNSLVANLPIGMMREFVKRGFWTVEQAWAYVERMQDEAKATDAIEELTPHLTKSLVEAAARKAWTLNNDYHRARIFCTLAQHDINYFTEAVSDARTISEEFQRAGLLTRLAQFEPILLSEALEAVRAVNDTYAQAKFLRDLAKLDRRYITEALERAEEISNRYLKARAFLALAEVDQTLFDVAREAIRSASIMPSQQMASSGVVTQVFISNEENLNNIFGNMISMSFEIISGLTNATEIHLSSDHPGLPYMNSSSSREVAEAAGALDIRYLWAKLMIKLAKFDNTCYPKILEVAKTIVFEPLKADILCDLAEIDCNNFAEALNIIGEIPGEEPRALVLSRLARIDHRYFANALEAVKLVPSESSQKAEALSVLSNITTANFSLLLETSRAIQDEFYLVESLSKLAQLDDTYCDETLELTSMIRDAWLRTEILITLTTKRGSYIDLALEAARTIQDDFYRAKAFYELAKLNSIYFVTALDAARSIKWEETQAYALLDLAKLDVSCCSEAVEVIRKIEDKESRASLFGRLAKIDVAYFDEALEAARSAPGEHTRAYVLSDLAKINDSCFEEALEAARAMEIASSKATIMSKLAKLDAAYFEEALEAARASFDGETRAYEVSRLTRLDSACFAEALEIMHGVQPEALRSGYLKNLMDEVPQDLPSNFWVLLSGFTHQPSRAQALSTFLPALPLSTIAFSDWKFYLRLLASRERKSLMQDLVTLYPAITLHGGEVAMRGVVDAMREVCDQWN